MSPRCLTKQNRMISNDFSLSGKRFDSILK